MRVEPLDPTGAIREAELAVMLGELFREFTPENYEALRLFYVGYHVTEIAELVLVDGRHLTSQAWNRRLGLMKKRILRALDLLGD
jgi:hypothetical protein